jgi:hypothetical protein
MERPGQRRAWGPSLSTIWGLLAWLLVPLAVVLEIGPIEEADLYWHIRMGEDILANGRFGGDPSWTYGPADAAWVTTQAASEVLLYAIHAATSWGGLLVLRMALAALLAVSILAALTAVVRHRPVIVRDRVVAIVGGLSILAMVPFVQERPQTLSLILLPWVGVLALRVMYTDRWPRWWVVGLVVMVWSWFHGAAALVGPLLLGVALLHALGAAGLKWLPAFARSLRRGWLTILSALVAPMIGPAGWSYYPQVAAIQEAASDRILEWQPPDANNLIVWGALAFVGIWMISVVRLAARTGRVWRTVRMDAMYVTALVLVMTSAGRYLAIGILLLGPLVARRLAQAWWRPAVRVEWVPKRLSVILVGVAALGAAAIAVLAVGQVRPVGADRPLQVWQAMAGLEGERRVFVDYALGGQAGLLGDVVVSIDGRADRYGARLIDLNRDFVVGRPGWQDTLARYPGTTDVVVQSDGGVVDDLEQDGWTVACVDGSYTWLTAPGVTGGCPEE